MPNESSETLKVGDSRSASPSMRGSASICSSVSTIGYLRLMCGIHRAWCLSCPFRTACPNGFMSRSEARDGFDALRFPSKQARLHDSNQSQLDLAVRAGIESPTGLTACLHNSDEIIGIVQGPTVVETIAGSEGSEFGPGGDINARGEWRVLCRALVLAARMNAPETCFSGSENHPSRGGERFTWTRAKPSFLPWGLGLGAGG